MHHTSNQPTDPDRKSRMKIELNYPSKPARRSTASVRRPSFRPHKTVQPLFVASLSSCLVVCQPSDARAQQSASPTAGVPQPAATATPQSATAPTSSRLEDTLKSIKNPADWFSWGGDFRYRNEYFNNAVSISHTDPLHEQDLQRFRERIWAAATPTTNLVVKVRLVSEPREWMETSFLPPFKGHSGLEWRYGQVDSLNVQLSNVLGQPLTITAGRQDVPPGEIGDGWLVGDGTPLDGSMSYYFDAFRVKYIAEPIQTKFNLMYIYQDPQADAYIPTLNASSEYPLVEQREQGVILHASNTSLKNLQVDGYFMYKHDNRETFNVTGVTKTPGDNGDIYTVGGSLTGTPAEHWSYSVEGAYQFGSKEDKVLGVFASRDLDAFGGKTKVTYSFKDAWNNQISLNGEFLSGDDPKTPGKDEMFDVLWGRWPRWSDMVLYAYPAETGGRLGQMNNLGRIGPTWSCNPTKKLTVSLTYNALLAPEEVATRSVSPFLSSDGNFRGHFAQAAIKYQFNKRLSGHLWGEWMWEGDYYKQSDLMSFLRAEMTVTF